MYTHIYLYTILFLLTFNPSSSSSSWVRSFEVYFISSHYYSSHPVLFINHTSFCYLRYRQQAARFDRSFCFSSRATFSPRHIILYCNSTIKSFRQTLYIYIYIIRNYRVKRFYGRRLISYQNLQIGVLLVWSTNKFISMQNNSITSVRLCHHCPTSLRDVGHHAVRCRFHDWCWRQSLSVLALLMILLLLLLTSNEGGLDKADGNDDAGDDDFRLLLRRMSGSLRNNKKI